MNYNLQQWLDRYGESHQNHTNKRIHHICVPLIFMTIVGFMYNLSPTLTLGVSLAVAIFYFRLGLKPLLIFGLLLGLSIAISKLLSLSNPILLLIFIFLSRFTSLSSYLLTNKFYSFSFIWFWLSK